MLRLFFTTVLVIAGMVKTQAQSYEILQQSLGDLEYYGPSKGTIVITDSTFSLTFYYDDSGSLDTSKMTYTIVKKEGYRYTLKNIVGWDMLCVFTEPEDKRDKKRGIMYLQTTETDGYGKEMKWKYILRKLD